MGVNLLSKSACIPFRNIYPWNFKRTVVVTKGTDYCLKKINRFDEILDFTVTMDHSSMSDSADACQISVSSQVVHMDSLVSNAS